MSKLRCVLILLMFFLSTSIAPLASIKQFAQVCTDTDAQIFLMQVFEEEIHSEKTVDFFVSTHMFELAYPFHLTLVPQIVLAPALKPPLV